MTLFPGDIVFVMHHGSWVSRAFGWFMGSKWSHSAMVADVGNLDTYLHETSDTQTKVGMLSRYVRTLTDSVEIIRLPINQTQRVMAAENAAHYHDAMYGYLRLVGAGVRRLMIKIGWKSCPMLWPWGGPLCMMIPHRGIASVMSCPKVGTIDTEELYQWCKNNGHTVAFKHHGQRCLYFFDK